MEHWNTEHYVGLRFGTSLMARDCKTITAAVVLSASIAAPAFAQEAYQSYSGAPYRHAPQTYYRSDDVPGSYARRNGDEFYNQEGFGFSGRDTYSAGGHATDVNPPGN
jgi:hypothetical protein